MFALAAVGADGTQIIVPIDVVELVKAVLSGLTLLLSGAAAIYAAVASARLKQAEFHATHRQELLNDVKLNVQTIEKNTNSLAQMAVDTARRSGVQEGVQQSVAVAEVLAEGQRQGREIERGSQQGEGGTHKSSLVEALPGAIAKVVPEVETSPLPKIEK